MIKLPYIPRTPIQVSQRVVQDIPEGAFVNLGVGRPVDIANRLPPDREIILHSENGILGIGPLATGDAIDSELVSAGKQNITLVPGGSIFHHGDSFAMIRGGHIDICVLGAFQVSAQGDLANWRTLNHNAVPAVGGAMDLALGAKQVFVVMDLLTKEGVSKIVPVCTYPLTGAKVVDRVYTDLATFAITPAGIQVVDMVEGLIHAELERMVGMPLLPCD